MGSQYLHGRTYDLFLSYSSRDLNWVRPFFDELIADVNRFADLDVFPFLDQTRLQPGYIWDEQILAAAADSAVFVPILSPRFFQSDYCQKEVLAFIEAGGLSSGSAHRSRILPVKFLCSAPADHALGGIQTAEFCAVRDNGVPFEYLPGSMEHRDALRKLSYNIAQLLKMIPPKEQQRPAVYLASNFKPESEKLRASLNHHFDVLPQDPKSLLGASPGDLKGLLQRDFARCFVSVHPLSGSPLAKGVIDAQIEFAKTQQKPRLVWTPEQPDELTNAGFEWFTSQAEIEDRIRRLQERPPESKSRGVERLIYFLCSDRANKSQAEPLLDFLEERGVHVYPSPLEGPADEALQTHARALDELDGCLIYYGDVDRAWFDAVFMRVQRKIRQRGLLSAIFLAPPPTEHKTRDLRNIGVTVVDGPDAAAKAFSGFKS